MLLKSDIKNVIDSAKYCISGVETLIEQKPTIENIIVDAQKELKQVESRISFLADTKTFYVKAIDVMYEESIGALKETLNTALQYIITDKNYSCNIKLEDKRGTKNLFISLVDNDEDFEVDLKNSTGQGVRAVISAVLKVFYLINQDSKILLLDEKWSALSDQYVSNFFAFLHNLCDEKGIIAVMISHDPRFFDYADRTYLVADGNVQLLGKEDNVVLE